MERIPLEKIRAALAHVLADYRDVAAVYAYGSRVTGGALPVSDLDLAIVLRAEAEPGDPLYAERIAARLATALETSVKIVGGTVQFEGATGSVPQAVGGEVTCTDPTPFCLEGTFTRGVPEGEMNIPRP